MPITILRVRIQSVKQANPDDSTIFALFPHSENRADGATKQAWERFRRPPGRSRALTDGSDSLECTSHGARMRDIEHD